MLGSDKSVKFTQLGHDIQISDLRRLLTSGPILIQICTLEHEQVITNHHPKSLPRLVFAELVFHQLCEKSRADCFKVHGRFTARIREVYEITGGPFTKRSHELLWV